MTSVSEEPAWKQRAVERSIRGAKLRAVARVGLPTPGQFQRLARLRRRKRTDDRDWLAPPPNA